MTTKKTEPEQMHADPTGWVKLFLKGQPGVLVTLPVRADSAEQAAVCVREYLEYFQPFDPSLEPGQHRSTIVAVIRRRHQGKDGPVVALDLYVDETINKFKTQTVYLDPNRPGRRAAFEKASGFVVDKMMEWDDKPLDWTSNSFNKYAARPQRPFEIVQKDNPDYNPEKPMEAPKRHFVGFIDPATGGLIEEDKAAPTPLPPQDFNRQDRHERRIEGEVQPPKVLPKPEPKQGEPGLKTFRANRIDTVVRQNGSKFIRFLSDFRNGNVQNAVAFGRDVFRATIGENDADFHFLNAPNKPYFDELMNPGEHYPNVLIDVTAERKVKEDGTDWWEVVGITETTEKNSIPSRDDEDIPF